MKNIIFLLCVLPIFSHAQIKYNDTTSNVSGTAYAGTLAGPMAMIKKDVPSSAFYSIRAGGTILWSPTKYFSIFGLGAGELNQTDTVTPFTHLCVKIKPIKSVLMTFGKTASLLTEIFRPLPTTQLGQFEPWTMTHIPGPALGGKISFSPSRQITIYAGNFWRGKEASSELAFRYKGFNIAGYYMNESKIFGGAINFASKKFNTTVMYNQNKNTAMYNAGMYNSYEIPWIDRFTVYSDVGVNPNSWKILKSEFGFFKTAQLKYVQLLLGISYNDEIIYSTEVKCVKGNAFLHL